MINTVVSIPDELFSSAEQFAQRKGLSRDELYATALKLYLNERSNESITEQLNAVYGEESNLLDSLLARMQAKALPRDSWE